MKPQVNFWVARVQDGVETCVRCTLLQYSGDSYRDKADILYEDGTQDYVKLGWLSRREFDVKTYDKFRAMDSRYKHILGGNRPETYKSRSTKTKWSFAWGAYNDVIRDHPRAVYEFRTLAEAIRGAQAALMATGADEIELFGSTELSNKRHTEYDSAARTVRVNSDGSAIMYTSKRHDLSRVGDGSDMNRGTYMRGFGSGKNSLYTPKRVYWGGKRRKFWRTV